MGKEKLKSKQVVMTKKEACYLLKVNLKDLKVFEKSAKIKNGGNNYTYTEFSRLRRSVASFNGLIDEEKGIGR